jgi:hypothetical protein
VDSTPSGICLAPSKWGLCQQPAEDGERCSAHTQWEIRGTTPDSYYERKVVLGLVQPTWDWMTDEEAEILLNGRYRGDGRRLDAWVAGDPIGVEL